MRITTAICTWNRCQLLDQTLARMAQLRIPKDVTWELLVVNNNCSDDTDQILGRHARALPLRRLFEPRPGLSHARNHATREASGDYILWTDDDVLVDEGWLEAYCQAFRRWPNAAVFGGPVQPWFEGDPPAWLQEVFPRVAMAFAARDLGNHAMRLTGPELPFGANMAFRAVEQRRHLYNPDLGVRGQDRVGGEDTTLIRDILDAGGECWWVPNACVRHFIPKHRQTLKFVRSIYYSAGQSSGRNWSQPETRTWFGWPRWLLRQAVEAELRYRWRHLFSRPGVWIEALIHASVQWGLLHGYKERCRLLPDLPVRDGGRRQEEDCGPNTQPTEPVALDAR